MDSSSPLLYHFEANPFYFEWNIRDGPSESANPIGTLNSGEIFDVSEIRDGVWLKIRTRPGIEGWALSEISGVKMLKPYSANERQNDSKVNDDISGEAMKIDGESETSSNVVRMTEQEMIARALELSVQTAAEDRMKRKNAGGTSGLEGVARCSSAKSDVDFYLSGYPGVRDDPDMNDNLLFYRNHLPSRPDGIRIEGFLKDKFGKYEWLERAHGYIQWLFPTRDSRSTNDKARPLQLHEAEAIATEPELRARVVGCYRLILDFFGMHLKDEKTGKIERLPPGKWEAQYKNLQESSHNYLRSGLPLSIGKRNHEIQSEILFSPSPLLPHTTDAHTTHIPHTHARTHTESLESSNFWVKSDSSTTSRILSSSC